MKMNPLIPLIPAVAAGFVAFMATWLAGCFVADFVLHIPANSWRMLFGFVVGSAGIFAMNRVAAAFRHGGVWRHLLPSR